MKSFTKRIAFDLLIICIVFSNVLLVYANEKNNEVIVSGEFGTKGVQEEEELSEVEIIQAPKKTDYIVGEKFKPTGLKFKLPNEKTITYSALNASSFRFEPSINEELTLDVEYVVVTYKDYSFDIPITVNDYDGNNTDTNINEGSAKTQKVNISTDTYGTKAEMEIDEIEIVQPPKKGVYKEGEKFKPNGLKFKLPNGKTVTYSMLNSHLFKFNPTVNTELVSGIESIEVTYGDYTFSIPIVIESNVQESDGQDNNSSEGNNTADALVYAVRELKGIEQLPTKVKYKKGEKFNPSGLKITLKNGKVVSYNAINNHLFKFAPKLTENLTKDDDHVVVIYQDGSENGQEFYIPIEVQQKVIGVTANVESLFSCPGQPFDPTGLTLNLEMEDGTVESVTYNETTKDDFEFIPNCVGETVVDGSQVTVKYKGFDDLDWDESWNLEMAIQEANEPRIVNPPNKLVYKSGEKFDPNGLKLYMNKLDGEDAPVFEGVEMLGGGTFIPQDMFVVYDDGAITSKLYEGWNGNADQFIFDPPITEPLTTQSKEKEVVEIKIRHKWTSNEYTQKITVLPSEETIANEDDSLGDNISVEWHLNKDEYWKWDKFDPTGTYLTITQNGVERKIEYNEDTKKFFTFGGSKRQYGVTHPDGRYELKNFPLAPGKILYFDTKGITITYDDGKIKSTKGIIVRDCQLDGYIDFDRYCNQCKVGQLRNLNPIDFVFNYPDGTKSVIPFADMEDQGFIWVQYLRTPVTKDNHNVWLEWGGEDLQVEWELELVDEVDNSKVWAGIKFPYNNDGKDEKQ